MQHGPIVTNVLPGSRRWLQAAVASLLFGLSAIIISRTLGLPEWVEIIGVGITIVALVGLIAHAVPIGQTGSKHPELWHFTPISLASPLLAQNNVPPLCHEGDDLRPNGALNRP